MYSHKCSNSVLLYTCLTIVLGCWSPATAQSTSAQARGQSFPDTFRSTADGTDQPIVIQLPPGYTSTRDYPLLVSLSFRLPTPAKLPAYRSPYVKVHATGHKLLAYLGLVEQDVLAILDKMQQDYAIDPRRIFLSGYSAGASSATTIVSRHPDRFAGVVPIVAFGNNAILENLQNVAVFCHHGQRDWVSAIDNVRVYFQQLRAIQSPALLKEYPQRGHSVGPLSIDSWLMATQRADRPRRVTYRCDSPDYGRAYYFHIRKFRGIHRDARFVSGFHGHGEQQTLILQVENIDVLEVNLARSPVDLDRKLLLQMNRDQLRVEPPLPATLFLVNGETGWNVSTQWEQLPNKRRAYRPGAAGNLYNGEPLLVVYGTKNLERRAALKRVAEELARCGGPYYTLMKQGFPIKPDHLVTEQDLNQYNLLLVGGAKDNELVSQIAGDLPFSITGDMQMQVTNRRPVPLDSAVLGCAYFHPHHPGRLIYIFAPYLSPSEFEQLAGNTARFLPGADGLAKGDQPDLVVQTVDQLQRCQLQFDAHWRWRSLPGAQIRFPEPFQSRTALAERLLTILRRRAGADWALWWGPRNKPFVNHDFNTLQAYDPSTFTQSDYRTKSQPWRSMTGFVTGQELAEIHQRWIGRDEIQIVPTMDPKSLEPTRRYRLVLPHELVVKLGKRQRLLRDVAEGPAVTPDELLEEVFR